MQLTGLCLVTWQEASFAATTPPSSQERLSSVCGMLGIGAVLGLSIFHHQLLSTTVCDFRN